MEKDFERQLRQFGAIEKLDAEDAEEQRAAAIAEAAELTQTDPATQEKVYELQKKKAEIMAALHERLKVLDDPKAELVGHGRTISFDAATGVYLMWEKGGKKTPITLGEIMTGSIWGQQYKLDQTVARGVRKQYLVNDAHQQLMDHLDQQIATTRAESSLETNSARQESYAAISKQHEVPLLERKAGIIAEQLVSSFLTRVAIDHDLPFEIIPADAQADVEYKIDFIVHAKDAEQGVSVEADHKSHDVGIQFTTSTVKWQLERKHEQATKALEHLAAKANEAVERIVVVSVPVNEVKQILQGWQAQKNRVGGPDKLLPAMMQEKIFKGVLRDVFSEDNVNQMWERVNASVAATPAARRLAA